MNVPKFVKFISISWYPQKWKGQILAHDNHPVTEQGYPWLLCIQTFLVFLLSPNKSIAFHNTTNGGYSSARMVIILYYNKILYDNKLTNAMLWSSSQMWSWLHPFSIGFILRKCAPTVGFIAKYSWLYHPRFSRANSSAVLQYCSWLHQSHHCESDIITSCFMLSAHTQLGRTQDPSISHS